jgi:hypothetical protein
MDNDDEVELPTIKLGKMREQSAAELKFIIMALSIAFLIMAVVAVQYYNALTASYADLAACEVKVSGWLFNAGI